MERKIYMEIESEKTPFQDKDLHLDLLDASLIVNEYELLKLKNYYKHISTKEQFETTRIQVLQKYLRWIEKEPERFGMESVNMKQSGINVVNYLSVLEKLSYEAYSEAISNCKPMISESQVVMRLKLVNDTLESLKTSLQNLGEAIAAKLSERQGYLDKADEIQKIYDRMSDDKKSVKDNKKTVNTFHKKTYTDFKGNKHDDVYKAELENLLDSYDIVIDHIDTNLDELNNEILFYKNKASDCLGPLGMLQSAYDSLKTKIQNWTN